MLFSDLLIVDRSMERLARQLSKKKAYPERQADEALLALLLRLKEALELEAPIRDLALSPQEMGMIRGYQFFTSKPALVVLNVGEQGSDDPDAYLSYLHRRSGVICLRGGLEMEIAQLDDEEAALFVAEYGIKEPGLHRMIRLSYGLLDVHSFFHGRRGRGEKLDDPRGRYGAGGSGSDPLGPGTWFYPRRGGQL